LFGGCFFISIELCCQSSISGMRVLILGGTQFIGRHIVETLHAGGHTVSTLNRGKSRDELPATVERLRGNRDDGPSGLEALKGRSWDACVDVSG
jgi:2'-hydroxyisoflavone reductase